MGQVVCIKDCGQTWEMKLIITLYKIHNKAHELLNFPMMGLPGYPNEPSNTLRAGSKVCTLLYVTHRAFNLKSLRVISKLLFSGSRASWRDNVGVTFLDRIYNSLRVAGQSIAEQGTYYGAGSFIIQASI